MKALFGSLLCLVLGASQSFAISGGPFAGKGASIVGTYGGVLQGAFDPTNPASSNTIGVFSLGVPQTGSATGPFVMFARGRVFSGTIQGSADPNKGAIKGVLTASFAYNLQRTTTDAAGVTTVLSVPVTATVNGSMAANVTTRSLAAGKAATLRGTATLNVEQGQVAANGDPVVNSTVSLTVAGFKQSNIASTGTASASPAATP